MSVSCTAKHSGEVKQKTRFSLKPAGNVPQPPSWRQTQRPIWRHTVQANNGGHHTRHQRSSMDSNTKQHSDKQQWSHGAHRGPSAAQQRAGWNTHSLRGSATTQKYAPTLTFQSSGASRHHPQATMRINRPYPGRRDALGLLCARVTVGANRPSRRCSKDAGI